MPHTMLKAHVYAGRVTVTVLVAVLYAQLLSAAPSATPVADAPATEPGAVPNRVKWPLQSIDDTSSDVAALDGRLQRSAAAIRILGRNLEVEHDDTDGQWIPAVRDAVALPVQYTWVVANALSILSPSSWGRKLVTLRSTKFPAASVSWQLQLSLPNSSTHTCGQEPSAPVELHLAPVLAGAHWADADRVAVGGRLELHGAPADAEWRSHDFESVVSLRHPAIRFPGLTCGHLAQSVRGDELAVRVSLTRVAVEWHPDSGHVEAQLGRAAQQHLTLKSMASVFGVLPRLEALNASFVQDAASGRFSVRYRHGADEYDGGATQLIRRLMFDNMVCHRRGDVAAATRQFCDLMQSAASPAHAWHPLRDEDMLQLFMPCEDGTETLARRRGSSAAPRGPRARATAEARPPGDGQDSIPSFYAGPECEGTESTNFNHFLAAAVGGPGTYRHVGAASQRATRASRRGRPHAGSAAAAAPAVPQHTVFSQRGDDGAEPPGLTLSVAATGLLLGAWLVSRRVVAAAAGSGKGRRRCRPMPEASAPPARTKPPPPAVRPCKAGRCGGEGGQAGKAHGREAQQREAPRRQLELEPGSTAQSYRRTRGTQPHAVRPAVSAGKAPFAVAASATAGVEERPARPAAGSVQGLRRTWPTPSPQLGLDQSNTTTPEKQRTPRPAQREVPVTPPPPPAPALMAGATASDDQRLGQPTEPEAATQAAPESARVATGTAVPPPPSLPAPTGGPDAGATEPCTCLVCLDRPWRHGFLHGGSVHIGVCGECLAALQAAGRGRGAELSCPVCRGRVERTVALFA